MYTTMIKRELVKPGQAIRVDGLIYTASAQRGDKLYMWREVPGGVRTNHDCLCTSAREVELVVNDSNFRQYANAH